MSRSSVAVAALSAGRSQCPFLYQTRTILSQHTNRQQYRRNSTISSAVQEDHSLAQPDGGNNVQGTAESQSFLTQKAAQVASRKPKHGPSITAAERAAFDSIWALFEKPTPSSSDARATSIDHTNTDHKHILGLFSTPPKHSDETKSDDPREVATDGTIPTMSSRGREATHLDTHVSRRSQSRLNRQGAMAEIRGFLKDTPGSDGQSSPNSVSEATNEIHSSALKIIEDAADSFSTALRSSRPRPDMAMWKVAEDKVFPLIKLLRPAKSSLSSSEPPSDTLTSSDDTINTHQSTRGAAAAAAAPPPPPPPPPQHPSIPSHLPLLPLLSLIYPSLTLLTLRFYTAHHPTSPYALTLLPTLKSLGPTSYVLGAHTHFYNTLLSLYWCVYSDLRGMNGLLAEMDANGVELDVGTWEVLKGIGEDRQMDLNGRGGAGGGRGRGKMWWGRMEQVVWWERVGVEWCDVVKSRLQDRGLITADVMREERSSKSTDDGVGNRDGDGPDYVVTL